jgi:hypothetical protein
MPRCREVGGKELIPSFSLIFLMHKIKNVDHKYIFDKFLFCITTLPVASVLFYNGHGCVNINEDKKVKLSLCLSTML